jgi:hypothetical protein
MRRFITLGVAAAVSISFVEGMTRGFFSSGPGSLESTSPAPSDNVVASEPVQAISGRHQRARSVEQVRRNDDGYVEGLAATLGYQSPELMATGSLGSGHNMAQR